MNNKRSAQLCLFFVLILSLNSNGMHRDSKNVNDIGAKHENLNRNLSAKPSCKTVAGKRDQQTSVSTKYTRKTAINPKEIHFNLQAKNVVNNQAVKNSDTRNTNRISYEPDAACPKKVDQVFPFQEIVDTDEMGIKILNQKVLWSQIVINKDPKNFNLSRNPQQVPPGLKPFYEAKEYSCLIDYQEGLLDTNKHGILKNLVFIGKLNATKKVMKKYTLENHRNKFNDDEESWKGVMFFPERNFRDREEWHELKNVAFMAGAIKAGKIFHLVTPISYYKNRGLVTRIELAWLKENGYSFHFDRRGLIWAFPGEKKYDTEEPFFFSYDYLKNKQEYLQEIIAFIIMKANVKLLISQNNLALQEALEDEIINQELGPKF